MTGKHQNGHHPLILDRSITVVCFDAGFTLIEPHPSVGDVYARIAARFGYTLDPEWLEQRFFEVYSDAAQRIGSDDPAPFNMSEEKAREWWYMIVQKTFGDTVDREVVDDLCEALFEEYASANCWKMCKGVPDVLVKIRSARPDLRLAVLSNWDARIVSVFDDLGLARYFEDIFYSAAIGYEKPGRRAFEHVIESSGIAPQEMLHIGDSLEDDARGALAVGARALLVERSRKSIRHRAAENEEIPCEILGSLEELFE